MMFGLLMLNLFCATILHFATAESKEIILKPGNQTRAWTFKVAPVEPEIPHFIKSNISVPAERVSLNWRNHNRDEPPLTFEVGLSNHKNLVLTGRQENAYNSDDFSQRAQKLRDWGFTGFPNHRYSCSQTIFSSESEHSNGLIATVLAAYNNHIPLILSPDDFWLPIALSVGEFLGEDEEMAEKYRKLFVNHDGKKKLIVNGNAYGIVPKCPSANEAGWPMVVEQFSKLIQNQTATDIAPIMSKPFSTSSPIEQTAKVVTLMETMKNYFEYVVSLFRCGIPEITLEGSIADYQSLIDRVDGLLEIFPNFEWYLNRVRTHLSEVLRTKNGNPDRDWWRQIVLHQREGSGGQSYFTGWLSDFFAFKNKHAENRGGNARFTSFERPALTLTDFSLIDCKYTYMQYDMKLAAGFLGVALDEKRSALRPAIGWMTFYHKEEPAQCF